LFAASRFAANLFAASLFAASRLLVSAAFAEGATNMRTVIAVTRLSLVMNDRVDSAVVCDMTSPQVEPRICDQTSVGAVFSRS
jgi:hypothetical protein